MKTEQIIKELKDKGFTFLFKEEFDRPKHQDSSPKDDFYVFFNYDKGILACFDTFWNKEDLNGGSLFYNHTSLVEKGCYRGYSSGKYYFLDRDDDYPSMYKDDKLCSCHDVFKEKRINWFDSGIEWEEYRELSKDYTKRYMDFMKGKGYSYVWSGYEDIRSGIYFHDGEYLKQWVDSDLIRTVQIYFHYHDSEFGWEDKEGEGYKRLCKLPENVKQRILFKEEL